MKRWWLLVALALAACRIETAAPANNAPASTDGAPRGDLWVYTSMYRHVLDALEPLLKERLPQVTVRWFQGGSEKVATRLEAELTAGGSPCDVLMTSDPFLYRRLAQSQRLARTVSVNGVRTPRALLDPDGHWEAVRVSTMVLAHRAGQPAPSSFAALLEPTWKGEVVVGDPLTSGTAFTWAVAMERTFGADFFPKLRANGARVAGGNAAVLQKIEGGEAKVGVVLLENVLAAKARGSPVEAAWPTDGAVIVPGPVAVLSTSRNPIAAKAFIDVLLSPEGQRVIRELGDMHAVDPRQPGPRGLEGIEPLLTKSAPFDEALLDRGLAEGPALKARFTAAFSQ
ncbi:MAG: ABC transporter substrate-binding protein [Myxococcaceae bacterium]|jgi:iron(III) transport system substrate-binding protein|nr:ABC transporter substrate-binding protein [Myxococcaceae bacterium]